MNPGKAIAPNQNGKLKKRILQINDAYYKDTELFVRFLDEKNLPIDYEGLKLYTQHLEDKGYAAASFNKKIAAAKNRIRFLFEHSPESLDLTKRFRIEQALSEIKPKKINTRAVGKDRVLSKLEIKTMIDRSREEVSEAVSLMIEFLALTALRISEMLSIRIGDLKRTRGNYHIRIRGKGRKERIVMVDRKVVQRVMDHFAGEVFLFEHSGKTYNRVYVTDRIKLAGRLILGKNISAHTFRHSFATEKLKQTKNLKGVSKYLGHSSVSTTADLYVHDELGWEDVKGL